MGFFSQQVKEVEIDAENRVTLRKLTYGEASECQSLALTVNPVMQDVVLDIAKLQREQIKRAVVDWTGPGFEGKPVSPENILALPVAVVNKIREAYEAWEPALTEAEGNGSAAPTS